MLNQKDTNRWAGPGVDGAAEWLADSCGGRLARRGLCVGYWRRVGGGGEERR